MEEARVEIRNIRRDAADQLKKEERDGTVGADESHRQLDLLQKTTDRHIAEVDAAVRPRNRRSSRSSGPRNRSPAPSSSDRPTPPAAHEEFLPPDELPRHVAIIMDGNRRWARAQGKAELEGHAAGVEAIRGLLKHAVRRGVPVLTLYAFSRENWARSDDEVVGLFGLLESAIRSETDEPSARRPGPAPGPSRRAARGDAHSIEGALAATEGGEWLLLNIAFNYAGRTELIDAIRRLIASGVVPRRSTRPSSGERCTRPACPTPTCSSGPAASSASRTSSSGSRPTPSST